MCILPGPWSLSFASVSFSLKQKHWKNIYKKKDSRRRKLLESLECSGGKARSWSTKDPGSCLPVTAFFRSTHSFIRKGFSSKINAHWCGKCATHDGDASALNTPPPPRRRRCCQVGAWWHAKLRIDTFPLCYFLETFKVALECLSWRRNGVKSRPPPAGKQVSRQGVLTVVTPATPLHHSGVNLSPTLRKYT